MGNQNLEMVDGLVVDLTFDPGRNYLNLHAVERKSGLNLLWLCWWTILDDEGNYYRIMIYESAANVFDSGGIKILVKKGFDDFGIREQRRQGREVMAAELKDRDTSLEDETKGCYASDETLQVVCLGLLNFLMFELGTSSSDLCVVNMKN